MDKHARHKAVDDLLGLAQHVELVSHQPGCVVFKVRASALTSPAAAHAGEWACRIPGIRNASLKLLSRKVQIDYDPGVLPPALWDDLAELRAQPDGEERLRARLEKALSKA